MSGLAAMQEPREEFLSAEWGVNGNTEIGSPINSCVIQCKWSAFCVHSAFLHLLLFRSKIQVIPEIIPVFLKMGIILVPSVISENICASNIIMSEVSYIHFIKDFYYYFF